MLSKSPDQLPAFLPQGHITLQALRPRGTRDGGPVVSVGRNAVAQNCLDLAEIVLHDLNIRPDLVEVVSQNLLIT